MISYSDTEKEFYKYLEDIEVVSFDIFDTLLVRPYRKPTDLFKHLEIQYNSPGFCNERVFAEIRSRIKAGGMDKETTINEIYECILPEYKDLKAKEKEFEKQVLKKNPFIYKLYKAAINRGKKIIAISDMYLPKEFLREVLDINGYNEVSQIYVSSEYKQNKDSKILYKIAIEDLHIKPEKILHIGDNLTADFCRAKDCRMKSVLTPKISDIKTIWDKRLQKCPNEFESGILSSIFKYREAEKDKKGKNYWKEFGYHLGGPLAVGYTEKIINTAERNQINSLLFVSRDGYVLQKVYNLLAKNPLENNYVYAPRILNLKCFLDYRNKKAYLEEILRFTANHVPQFRTKQHSSTEEKRLFEENKKSLQEYAKRNLDEYLKYIKSLHITKDRLAIVDMTTGAFSSLYFLKKIFDKKLIFGFYSGAFSHNTAFRAVFYNENIFSKEDTPLINLTEFLITAPEAPLEDIKDCKPIFKELSKYEKNKIAIYKDVMEGIIEFAGDYKEFFTPNEVSLSSETIFYLLREFTKTMTFQDRKKLKKIYHAEDLRSETYRHLFKYPVLKINLNKFAKNYTKIKKNLKRKIKYYIYKYTNIRFVK